MKKHLPTRLLCLALAAVMVMGLFPAVQAASQGLHWELTDETISLDRSDRLIEDPPQEPTPGPTDPVRVSIVLEEKATLRSGFTAGDLTKGSPAAIYDKQLHKAQKELAQTISTQALEGRPLDVVWNLTTVCNVISANVPYGKLDAIRAVPGVAAVIREQQYTVQTAQPNTASSAAMTGASTLWQTGLTGAGTRIAIIDTGTDTDHQSFDNGAYLHALRENAAEAGMAYGDYAASLNLLDAGQIASVLEHLNAYERIGGEAQDYYINEKLPFGANYVDLDLNVTHDYDSQSSHGSHVAGIAAANRYIPAAGGYADSLQSVFMCGVAPDAQIITMKVFGVAGGPSDSDYFAAIEDALWLGCDSINLSLGSGAPGTSENPLFSELLDYLATTDTVVVMSAGNSGHWAEHTANGLLYQDGVSFHTGGTPGTYTNSLSVASVDNDGTVGNYLEVAGRTIVYTENLGYYNQPMTSLDTSYDRSGTAYDYILIDGIGQTSDYQGLDLYGKVVICARGDISFSEKATNAARLGAAAVVVYNSDNTPFGMDLTDYRMKAPCVSILRRDAEAIRSLSQPHTTEAGMNYYTGTVNIGGCLGHSIYGSEYYNMSEFSSWGVPGSLELKPEITAPGGLIWSVNGVDPSGTQYEMMSGTSMAAPQVSGMAALVSQYIRSAGLDGKTGLSVRQLSQSLLMSTAQPLLDGKNEGNYHSILSQGAGLARVDLATSAGSYVLVEGMDDGKVKVELGEDPDRTGVYSFRFTIHDLSGKDTVYQLSADLFTQQITANGQTSYLDTATRPLPLRASFYSNGTSLESSDSYTCDLNGDGITNTGDADHLLEYLVGNADRLWADGDVDGDGSVTSYDAHVLLTKLSGSHSIRIPAGGSAHVEVLLELTGEARRELAENYPTGAYLEAFVYAEPLPDAEGRLGVAHSIPVLGYYGSWTEPGMFDIGSYTEYAAGSGERVPYLYPVTGFENNFLSIGYGGREEYLFGGNPIIQEEEYLPQRNAFNNRSGWMLLNLRFGLIRNAAASMIQLKNADTGEIYLAEELGQMDGAYYHVNMGAWQNAQQKLALGLGLEGLPEGTHLELSLIAAPELYCTYDPLTGSYVADWNRLGSGAALVNVFTIDNTAPQIQNVTLGEDHVLYITVRDNEYVAAAALLNAAGTHVLTASAANQTTPRQETTIALDLSQVYGREFYVAVYDYAENQTICAVTLELDTQRPPFTLVDCSSGESIYTALDADGTAVPIAISSRPMVRAAEYAEGAVFEITEDNRLHVARNEDLYQFTTLGNLDPSDEWDIHGFCDLAYNRSDGMLYGLFYSGLNNLMVPYLCTIDPYVGTMEVLGQMPVDACTITIDSSGNFYSTLYGIGQLHRYTSDVVSTKKTTLVGSTGGYKSTDVTSLAWDHREDALYWSFSSGDLHSLLKLDPSTAQVQVVCNYGFHARGLFIPYEPRSEVFAPTEQVRSVTMEPSAYTLTGNTVQLSALVLPWNLSDSSLVWTSSDESVATVDDTGLVLGITQGTAVITAASMLDASVRASCTVTVSSLDTAFNALVWDQEGQVLWSRFHTDNLPAYEPLAPAAENLPLNATMVADGVLYASALDTSVGVSQLYTVDPETFEPTLVGPSSIAYLDMTYSPSLGYGLATYFNYIVLVDRQTGEYLGAWDWADGIAADLVGISYYGTQYHSGYGAYMDYFLILDSDGQVYLEAFLNSDGEIGYFNGPSEGYVTTIGNPVDYSYFQGFHYTDGYAYWTRFSESENSVELIAWDCDNTGNAYSLGRFEEGVWPVAGLYTDAQLHGPAALADGSLSTAPMKSAAPDRIPAPHTPGGSLHSAARQDPEDALTFTLKVPAGAEDPTNGTVTVIFDPAALELTSVAGTTEAFAWKLVSEGTLSLAFADRTALALDAALAQLTFRPLDTGSTLLTVQYGQWNQWHLPAVEEFPVELPKAHMPFTDVPEGSFFYDPVLWAISGGITTGATETTFDPNGDCLRASVVTFLWRASGSPEPTSAVNPFQDVKESDFFYKAVLWAVENGITNGTSATTFSPFAKCNRAQVVTFLWRAMGQPAPASGENPFTDVDVAQFYGTAVLWAVENGITNGMGGGTFGVGSICNRAQVVTFLYRTMKK